MSRQLTPIVLLVALATFTLVSSVFVIDEGELAIVTQFGEYKRTVDQAGLHFKVPFVQQVNRMERRIMGSDNPPSSYLTKDKKFLVVDPITRWRIVDPLKFFTTVRDEVGAKARLDDIINSELRRELARNEFGEIVCVPEGVSAAKKEPKPEPSQPKPADTSDGSGDEDQDVADTDPGQDSDAAAGTPEDSAGKKAEQHSPVPPGRANPAPPPEGDDSSEKECGREAVMATVTRRVVEQTERYGIRVLDVRMKRTDLPTEVQESAFQRMRAERERVAKRYRSEGEEEAQKIRAETDKIVRVTLADAYEKAQAARGRGDAESISIYAKAYGKDPEFYAFIRSLATYEQTVGQQASVVLSTGSPLFRYFETPTAK